MKKADCKIGATVKIIQHTEDHGIIGKILEQHPNSVDYYYIEGCAHPYKPSQMDLVKPVDQTNNTYPIY